MTAPRPSQSSLGDAHEPSPTKIETSLITHLARAFELLDERLAQTPKPKAEDA